MKQFASGQDEDLDSELSCANQLKEESSSQIKLGEKRLSPKGESEIDLKNGLDEDATCPKKGIEKKSANCGGKRSSNKFQSRSEEDHSAVLKHNNINMTVHTNNIMEKFLDEDFNSDSDSSSHSSSVNMAEEKESQVKKQST
jgi:hypothetical protein